MKEKISHGRTFVVSEHEDFLTAHEIVCTSPKDLSCADLKCLARKNFTAAQLNAVDERFNLFTPATRKNSLNIGLIRNDSFVEADDLPNPITRDEAAIDDLQEAVDLLQGVVNKLRALGLDNE